MVKASLVPTDKNAPNRREWLESNWARQFIEVGSPLWLEVSHENMRQRGYPKPQTSTGVSLVSLGSFKNPGTFIEHWSFKPAVSRHYDSDDSDSDDHLDFDGDIYHNLYDDNVGQICACEVTFRHVNNELEIIHNSGSGLYQKFQMAYSQLESYIVLHKEPSKNSTSMYVVMKSRPKLFAGKLKKAKGFDEDEPLNIIWSRDVRFSSCPVDVLGSSSVLKLTPVGNTISDLIMDLEQRAFHVYHAAIESRELSEMPLFQEPKFTTFDAAYAWACVKSRGYQSTDRFTVKMLDILERNKDNLLLENILLSLSDELDSYYFCMPEEYICAQLKAKSVNEKGTNDDDLPPNYILVRRAVKTPLRTLLLCQDPIIENRVLRQYGNERFLRVAIRDEDFVRLNKNTASGTDVPMEEVKQFITRGVTVANWQYMFLACSNSQLREHGVWMYAEEGRNNIQTVRRWMGDFSSEKCVATFVSRMGQCFSSTKDTVDVSLTDGTGEFIEDITSSNYVFTDGIGKISPLLAKNVSIYMSSNIFI